MKRTEIHKARSTRIMRVTLVLAALILTLLMLPAVTGGIDVESNVSASAEDATEQTLCSETVPEIVPIKRKVTYKKYSGESVEPEETVSVEIVVEHEKLYAEADVVALAKMAWGEALVTNSDTEIAATMWCVLNRFDCGDPYYKNCLTIEAIVQQSGAFAGYSPDNPLDERLLRIAYDVLDRWNAERFGETDVGRTLPAEYLFFHGDGKHNHFRKEYKHDGHYWDWSLESPYET